MANIIIQEVLEGQGIKTKAEEDTQIEVEIDNLLVKVIINNINKKKRKEVGEVKSHYNKYKQKKKVKLLHKEVNLVKPQQLQLLKRILLLVLTSKRKEENNKKVLIRRKRLRSSHNLNNKSYMKMLFLKPSKKVQKS